MFRPSNCSLSLRFPYQYPICNFLFFRTFHIFSEVDKSCSFPCCVSNKSGSLSCTVSPTNHAACHALCLQQIMQLVMHCVSNKSCSFSCTVSPTNQAACHALCLQQIMQLVMHYVSNKSCSLSCTVSPTNHAASHALSLQQIMQLLMHCVSNKSCSLSCTVSPTNHAASHALAWSDFSLRKVFVFGNYCADEMQWEGHFERLQVNIRRVLHGLLREDYEMRQMLSCTQISTL